jgi:hypothetical protein
VSRNGSLDAETYSLPGCYARLTALEELVDGQQDPRINHLDDDDPEREFWPVERSRLLPYLRKASRCW